MNDLLLASLVPFVVTLAVVGWMLRHASSRLLDVPNARSSHTTPTPRGGGLGVLAGLLAGGVALLVMRPVTFNWSAALVLLALLAVAIVSFLDDLRPLPSRLRLLVHLAAAGLVLRAIGGFEAMALPGIGLWNVGALGVVLTLLWCIGLTNAYNFMDGIDGIAGAQAVVAGLAWGCIGSLVDDHLVATSGVALAAASLAFLRYNWSPARIFLGDVGSATIGLLLAVLPILALRTAVDPATIPPAALLIVWPFLFDAGFTLLRRLRRGENLLAAHRGHLYQRLVMTGWSHARVATLYLGLALLDALGAVVLVSGVSGGVAAAWLALLFTGIALPVLVGRAERRAGNGVSSGVITTSGGRPSAS